MSSLEFGGSTDLYRLLDPAIPIEWFHIIPKYFKQGYRHDLAKCDVLINLVTDPDQNPKLLETLTRLLRSYRGRIINKPSAVLLSRRDVVARRLAGIAGLHVPKVLRLRTSRRSAIESAVAEAGFVFPAIARLVGSHSGMIIGRFDSLAELLPHLNDGEEYFLTEFCDFQSTDGLYRKHRVFFAGDATIIRHLLISDEWSIHGIARLAMSERPDWIAEETELFREVSGAFPASVRAALEEVRRRIPLDLFGIDFGIARDGKLLLFEANATMCFLPVWNPEAFPHVVRARDAMQRALSLLVGASIASDFANASGSALENVA